MELQTLSPLLLKFLQEFLFIHYGNIPLFHFQASLLKRESSNIESEVEQLRIEVNKYKAYIGLLKDEVDLLQAWLKEKACSHDKAISVLTVEDETHWANNYLKREVAIFL